MAQITKEEMAKTPRKSAAELLAGIHVEQRRLVAVERELNNEWWRGYFAAKDGTAEITPEG